MTDEIKRPEYPTDAIPDEGLQPLGDPVEDEVDDDDVVPLGADDDTPAQQDEPEDDPAVEHEPAAEGEGT